MRAASCLVNNLKNCSGRKLTGCRYCLLEKRKRKKKTWARVNTGGKKNLTGTPQRTKRRAEAKQGFPPCIHRDKEKQRCSKKFASFYCQPFMLRMHHIVEQQVQLGADLTSSWWRARHFLALILMHNAVCQHCWGFIPLMLLPHFSRDPSSVVLL